MRTAVMVALVALGTSTAAAQGRNLKSADGEMPWFDPEQAVMFVERHDVCETPDAGIDAPDAGPDDGDAGTDASDAGTSCVPRDTITMAVQPRFTTTPEGARFAVLLATPAPPLYGTDSPSLFQDLARITAPELIEERIEDPDPALGTRCNVVGGCGGQSDQGCAAGNDFPTPGVPDGGYGDGGVEVIDVGPYEVLRLTATDTTALAAWLDQFGYAYTQADLDAVAPYLARGDTITAVRVDVDDPTTNTLSVLTLTWEGSEVRVPIALARPEPGVAARLSVYIVADGRRPLPNLAVAYAAAAPTPSEDFLTRTDLTIPTDATIDTDPVAYDGGTGEYLPVETVYVHVRVPVTDCRVEGSGGCCGAAGRRVRWDAVLVAGAMLLSIRRRRRRAADRR